MFGPLLGLVCPTALPSKPPSGDRNVVIRLVTTSPGLPSLGRFCANHKTGDDRGSLHAHPRISSPGTAYCRKCP